MEHSAELTIGIVRGGAEYARVTVRGHLDLPAALRLQTQLDAALDSGARYLTVDLSGVNGCDENVLDVLGAAARRAASQQGWLALTGGHHHIRFTAR